MESKIIDNLACKACGKYFRYKADHDTHYISCKAKDKYISNQVKELVNKEVNEKLKNIHFEFVLFG